MLGFNIFKTIGVSVSWIIINILNKFFRKSYKPYSEIWNGNQTSDYLNNLGHDIFYCGLGLILFLFFVWLTI